MASGAPQVPCLSFLVGQTGVRHPAEWSPLREPAGEGGGGGAVQGRGPGWGAGLQGGP